MRRALSGALVAALATGCGPGNDGRVEITPGLAQAVPWANGVVPVLNSDGTVGPTVPVFPTIPTPQGEMPDPGSAPVDCSPLANIELSPYTIMTFDPDPTVMGSAGYGVGFSSYDDGTFGSFRVTGDVTWYPGLIPPATPSFGLAADHLTKGPSCDGKPNNWALHIRGGRFDYYGMGVEYPLGAIVPCPSGSDLCPPPPVPGATADAVGLPLTAPNGQPWAAPAPHRYWDLSRYDGVTFWARRSPVGPDGFLVSLQDKHTSDALARENQTFCKRIMTCTPKCENGLSCNPDPNAPVDRPAYRCFDPSKGIDTSLPPSELEQVYRVCGTDYACRPPDYYLDPDFEGTKCMPYEFDGAQAAYYCYGGATTPVPPGMSDRCGDGWVTDITLSTDWQIYVIPFTEFRQIGFGKPAPFLDLKSIYEVAFLLPVGWSDVWIDNITFYRQR
jgi:hypothetical protein